jgi:hypothetical protein
MFKNILLYTLVAMTISVGPSMAQSQIDNNQPVQGSLNSRGVDLQNKLNASYKAGYLSSTENAEMQRDLDGILLRADRKASKDTGMSDTDFDGVSKAMDEFEVRIASKQVIKGGPASTAQQVIPAVVPGAMPLTGNQSSVVQPNQETYIVPTETKVVKESILVPSETVVKETVVVPSSETTVVRETKVEEGTIITPTEGSIVVPVD